MVFVLCVLCSVFVLVSACVMIESPCFVLCFVVLSRVVRVSCCLVLFRRVLCLVIIVLS